MEDEIKPEDPIVIASGTGLLSRAQIVAMVGEMIPAGMVIATRAYDEVDAAPRSRFFPALPKASPTNPERAAWNAAVDARKAAKRAGKEQG